MTILAEDQQNCLSSMWVHFPCLDLLPRRPKYWVLQRIAVCTQQNEANLMFSHK